MRIPWISILVTSIIVYFAATRLDWVAIWNALFVINAKYVAVSLIFWIGMMITRALKWRLILRAFNLTISWWESARMLWIGLFIGILTPGRIGDFVRVAYIHPPLTGGASLLAIVIDRLYDIFILIIFAIFGIVTLSATKNITLISNEGIAAIILVGLLGARFIFNKKMVRKTIYPLVKHFLPDTWKEMAEKHGREFYDAVPIAKKNILLIFAAGLVDSVSMIFSMGMGYFILLSLGADVNWTAAFLVVPVIALLEIVPFGIAGVGTREVASVIVLGAYAISPENAVLFSLLHFFLGYTPSFIAGAFLFAKNPPKIDEKLKNKIPFLKNKMR